MSETQVFGKVRIERLAQYSGTDLDDLLRSDRERHCRGRRFRLAWPPPRHVLESY